MHQAQHLFFIGAGRHHRDDLHPAGLTQAMNPGIALLQHRRVPGNVQVDQHRGVLKVEPHAAGVGGNEHLHRVVVPEPIHQFPATGRGYAAVKAYVPQVHPLQPVGHHAGHPFPLGKDHGLQAGLDTKFFQKDGQLIELRGALSFLVHQAAALQAIRAC